MIQSNINQTISLAGFLAQRSQWMEGKIAVRKAEKAFETIESAKAAVKEGENKRIEAIKKATEKRQNKPLSAEQIEDIEGTQMVETPGQQSWKTYKDTVISASNAAREAYYARPTEENLNRWKKLLGKKTFIEGEENVYVDYCQEQAEQARTRMAMREEDRIARQRILAPYNPDKDPYMPRG